jgi:peptide/nickel transport system ATP-binding protein
LTPSSFAEPLLAIEGLTVRYSRADGAPEVALEGVSLHLESGEILGISGESGCGKTTLAMALLRLLPKSAEVSAKRIGFRGQELQTLTDAELRGIRGKQIALIHQEPALSLNPVIRVGEQIAEVIRAHERLSRRSRKKRAGELLQQVHLDGSLYAAYPHELSGGEQRRVAIAEALACCPALVIADEPTAGLDRLVQIRILQLFEEIRQHSRISFLLTSHDGSVLNHLADRVLLMSQGRVIEQLLSTPPDQNSQIARVTPTHSKPQPRSENPPNSSHLKKVLVSAENVSISYRPAGVISSRRKKTQVLKEVNLEIAECSTLALMGPSGAGKSTLARCLALWQKPDCGKIWFDGTELMSLRGSGLRDYRPRIQLILQDGANAFNPNHSLAEIVEEPLLIRGGIARAERREQALQMMHEVGLPVGVADRTALELSGGQRQRVAIARALILKPNIIIFDESTSGLDRESEAHLMQLLSELQAAHKLTYLIITHDSNLARMVADQVAVLQKGEIVDCGVPDEVLVDDPRISSPVHEPKVRG